MWYQVLKTSNEPTVMMYSSIRVLIADNDTRSQALLLQHLKKDNFEIFIHETAESVLAELDRNPHGYDIVLINQNLPGEISGLDCLHHIKKTPKYSHLPVIMQTNEDEVAIIANALAAGVYYFLEKKTKRKLLQAVIFSAMENKMRFQAIEAGRNSLKTGLHFVENAQFSIRSLEDMTILTALLCSAYPDPDRVAIGIHELLTNAIEHGNLEISYKDKSELIINDNWKSEIEHRLNREQYKHKTVEVILHQNKSEIILTITDQGKGFDATKFMGIDPARLFDPHGRGIALAKTMSFDKLTYNNIGNSVTAIVML